MVNVVVLLKLYQHTKFQRDRSMPSEDMADIIFTAILEVTTSARCSLKTGLDDPLAPARTFVGNKIKNTQKKIQSSKPIKTSRIGPNVKSIDFGGFLGGHRPPGGARGLIRSSAQLHPLMVMTTKFQQNRPSSLGATADPQFVRIYTPTHTHRPHSPPGVAALGGQFTQAIPRSLSLEGCHLVRKSKLKNLTLKSLGMLSKM